MGYCRHPHACHWQPDRRRHHRCRRRPREPGEVLKSKIRPKIELQARRAAYIQYAFHQVEHTTQRDTCVRCYRAEKWSQSSQSQEIIIIIPGPSLDLGLGVGCVASGVAIEAATVTAQSPHSHRIVTAQLQHGHSTCPQPSHSTQSQCGHDTPHGHTAPRIPVRHTGS